MVKRMLLGLFWGLLACLAVTLLVGCGTKKVVVPEVRWRDSVVLRLQRDSVFLRDSVFVSQWVRGDTVYRDRVKTTLLYKDRVRTDTVLVSKRDTVTLVRDVEKKSTECKYRTHWYDKAARWVSLIVMGAIVGFVGYVAFAAMVRRLRRYA